MSDEKKYCSKCGKKLKNNKCTDCKQNEPTFDPYDLERQTYPDNWEILTS